MLIKATKFIHVLIIKSIDFRNSVVILSVKIYKFYASCMHATAC